jgi:hypothetical protein
MEIIMFNWLNRQLGDHAPMVGALSVLVFIFSAHLSYDFVRNFGVNDNCTNSSEVRRDLN